jgi:hypothetical protein
LISLFAAAAIQSSQIVEWLEPAANRVTIQAVVKLPELSTKQRSILRLVGGVLGRETKTYSGAQIADLAARTGSRVRVTVMEDHLRLGFEVVPADLNNGISVLGAMLRESQIEPAWLQSVADDLQFRRFPFWRQALDGRPFEPPKYSERELQEVVALVFRPENVTLGVGGKLTPGQATTRWDDMVSTWALPKAPRLDPPDTGTPNLKIGGGISVIEFAGADFSGTDAALTTRLLALTALGTGKGAALWRVAREKLGLSYRQEAVLNPTAKGFQPRLLIAHSGLDGLEEKAQTLKAALLDDIKAWTEEDKRRAIGMAESYLVRGGEMSPLYFVPGRPVSSDLADQIFLRAYWKMKAGTTWNPHQLVGRMGFVELADLKQAAEDIVASGKLRIYVGSK